MRFARRAGKRDTFEARVIEIAKEKGWKILQLDQFDLLCHRRGWTLMVEVKTGNAKLTGSQQNLLNEGWPLYVIRTEIEAEDLFK